MVKRVVGVIVLLAFVAMTTAVFAAEVYATKNGKKYHAETCPLIRNKQVTKIDASAAIQKGLVPCSKCQKNDAPQIEKQKKK